MRSFNVNITMLARRLRIYFVAVDLFMNSNLHLIHHFL